MKMESYKSQSGLDKLTNSGPCLTVILKKSLLGVPFFLEKLLTLTQSTHLWKGTALVTY